MFYLVFELDKGNFERRFLFGLSLLILVDLLLGDQVVERDARVLSDDRIDLLCGILFEKIRYSPDNSLEYKIYKLLLDVTDVPVQSN